MEFNFKKFVWTLNWLSEILASIDIMGAQVSAPFKPLNTIVLWCLGGFWRISQLGSHETPVSRTGVGLIDVFFFETGTSVWFQINLKTVNTIWFPFDWPDLENGNKNSELLQNSEVRPNIMLRRLQYISRWLTADVLSHKLLIDWSVNNFFLKKEEEISY